MRFAPWLPTERDAAPHSVGSQDCLHPHKSAHGSDYLGDMLQHWMLRAVQEVTLASTPALDDGHSLLPPPLFGDRAVAPSKSGLGAEWCYDLDAMHLAGGFRGNSRRRHAVWRTAHCAIPLQARERCSQVTADLPCPRSVQQGAETAANVWFFCDRALQHVPITATLSTSTKLGSGKISPGVLAVVPGATLWVELDLLPSWGSALARGAVRIRISYLTSYVHMGMAAVGCDAHCSCEPQTLDAHRRVNESIFASHWFPARVTSSPCVLRLTVLATTSSGGHKFKVNQISVMRAVAE